MEGLGRLRMSLKSRLPGLREREGGKEAQTDRQRGASGSGRVSPGSSSSLHSGDENLVALCVAGGLPPPPGHCDVAGRQPCFLREIREGVFQRAGTRVKSHW